MLKIYNGKDMENTPSRSGRPATDNLALKILLIAATAVTLTIWWLNTPPGVLGKADAAGYAVCHRISARSFFIGERQTPLCARCSGMYLGALLGIAYLSSFGKRSGMPVLKISIVLGAFLIAFGLDGVNSYMHFFPVSPRLYGPENWLRLLTGTGLGLGIAAILIPVVNQTLWRNSDPQPVLQSWRQFLPLLGLAALIDLAILSGVWQLLYPLAILSAIGILAVLTLVYTLVWVMVTRQENHFSGWRQLWMPLMAGFLTAMIQIGVLDAARYWFTGTWEGFNL
jgi:uncharacterized membrane protein